jgi:hypothetical protein
VMSPFDTFELIDDAVDLTWGTCVWGRSSRLASFG